MLVLIQRFTIAYWHHLPTLAMLAVLGIIFQLIRLNAFLNARKGSITALFSNRVITASNIVRCAVIIFHAMKDGAQQELVRTIILLRIVI